VNSISGFDANLDLKMPIQLFVGSWTSPYCVRHLRGESFILEESVNVGAVVRCKLKF